MRFILWTVSCVLTAGVLTLACGGGGGGGDGPGNELLSGTYFFLGAEAETDGGPQVTTTWGTITANGAGSLDARTSHSRNGDAEGPETLTGIPYTIGNDRSLRVVDPLDSSKTLAVGRVSPNGSIAVLGSLQQDSAPGLWIAIRRGGTFSPASLDDEYTVCMYRYSETADEKESDFGELGFDGIATGSGGFDTNINGHIVGGPDAVSYYVASDGEIDIEWSPLQNSTGGILAGNEIAVLAGSTFDNDRADLMACVRQAAGGTPARLSGQYFVAGIEFDLDSSEFRSSTGTFTADGAGSYSVSLRENVEGDVGDTPSVATGTYNVGPYGSLYINAEGSLRGAVSADGSFAVASGGVDEDDDPVFFFLVR